MKRIAILGASGFGKFHAREFAKYGEVVAILGSTIKSAIKTARILKKEFGIVVKPYSDLNKLIAKEKIDVVSICTPPELHEEQTNICIMNRINVLVEKPFYSIGLFELAKKEGVLLKVNLQLTNIIDNLSLPKKIKSVYIEMESASKGKEAEDLTPHLISLFERIPGKVNQKICSSKISYNPKRPRKLLIKINDRVFEKMIDEDGNYTINNVIIPDPLEVSIKKFMEEVNEKK